MSSWRRQAASPMVDPARSRRLSLRVDSESWVYKVPFRVSRGATRIGR
jgi:hypothetical protein